jgi:hypothetical protein
VPLAHPRTHRKPQQGQQRAIARPNHCLARHQRLRRQQTLAKHKFLIGQQSSLDYGTAIQEHWVQFCTQTRRVIGPTVLGGRLGVIDRAGRPRLLF